MANHYLLFSEAINHLNEAERAWCVTRLHHLETRLPTFDEEGRDEDDQPCAPDDEPYLNGAQSLGFQWQVTQDADGHSLWLYAEESGNAEHVALFAQEFLTRFRPHEYFTLTWAATCSKPRIGEFSGGAVFVTATEIIWNGVFSWLNERMAEFDHRKEPQPS